MDRPDALEAYLAHHGVKGMKWGVRRSDEELARARGGAMVSPKRRTAPLLGDYGDNKGASSKVSNYGSTMAGATAARVATRGALAKAAVTSASLAEVLGISAAGMGATIPASMATRAYLQPLSMAYHSSKSEIRKNTKALNEKYSQPGKNLRENKSLQKSYDSEYKKIVESALNRSKSGWTHPFRKIAETRSGKTSENQYTMKFYLTKDGVRKPYMTITSPSGRESSVKLGKFKHADDDFDYKGSSYDVVLTESDGYISDFSILALEDLYNEMEHQDGDYLEHHGVKGMKWGVRRSDEELDRAAGRKPRDRSIFKKKAKEVASKSSSDSEPDKVKTIRDLSTNELQAVVNRIRLEQQYAEMTTVKKDESYIASFAKDLGKDLMRDVVRKRTVKLVGRSLDNRLEKYFEKKGFDHLRDGYKSPLEQLAAANKAAKKAAKKTNK